MIFLLVLFSVLNLILTLFLIYGWAKLLPYSLKNNKNFTRVSVIIAARNEEKNISNCLNRIAEQNYPAELFEVIVIDDNSIDSTPGEVEKVMKAYPNLNLSLIKNSEREHFSSKKMAVSKGVEAASGNLILTTDADCVMEKNWIKTLVGFYEEHHSKFIAAPVNYHNENSIFQKWQSLEFLSLIGTTASFMKLKIPLMCNGANLAFEKKAFLEVSGYKGTEQIASGDDTFLMFKMYDKYPNDIHFIKSLEATVYTLAKESLADFYFQRKRWASKTSKYNKLYVMLVAITVYATNLFFIVGFIKGLSSNEWLKITAASFLGKLSLDFIFLYMVSGFFNKSYLLKNFPGLSLLYPFYIVLVATLAPFGKYQWKGRKTK